MAYQRSRGRLSLGEKRLAGLTVRRLLSLSQTAGLTASRPILRNTDRSTRPLSPALSISSSPVHAQLSHSTQTPLSSECSFTIKLADSALPPCHLRRIPSPHPSLARTSMLHRRSGSENCVTPSTATKAITSGPSNCWYRSYPFSIARSREPSSLSAR
jgi:hypothetical protein